MMKRIHLLIAVILLALSSCQSLDSKKGNKEDAHYQDTRQSLTVQEQRRPQHFLVVSGSSRKNLLGQTIVRGQITNKATIAIFKNVSLKFSFYSKTRVLLDTQQETIYDEFHPGDTKDFKSKYFEPKGTDSVGIVVTGADIVP